MPQPLRRWPKSGLEDSRGIISKRPELAIGIARVSAEWAHLEVALGHLLGVMLGAEASIGVTMYLALSGSAAQKSAMSAVAKERLSPDLFAKFEKLNREIRGCAKERNRVVHCLWLVSDDYPDALVSAPPEAQIRDLAQAISDRLMKGSLHRIQLEYINALRVYRMEDFDGIEQRIAETAGAVMLFVSEVINAKPAGWKPPIKPIPLPEAPPENKSPR